MSKLIAEACFEIANKYLRVDESLNEDVWKSFQDELVSKSYEVYVHFKDLGVCEKDVANALYYIAEVYSYGPIDDNDVNWIVDKLFVLMEIAFPNGGISKNSYNFANQMIKGLREQIDFN